MMAYDRTANSLQNLESPAMSEEIGSFQGAVGGLQGDIGSIQGDLGEWQGMNDYNRYYGKL